MRSRAEINKEMHSNLDESNEFTASQLMQCLEIELLLDIRDLIKKIQGEK